MIFQLIFLSEALPVSDKKFNLYAATPFLISYTVFVSRITSLEDIVKLSFLCTEHVLKETLLSANKLNAGDSRGLRWSFPGRIMLFRSSGWQLASLACHSFAFPFKMSLSIKVSAIPRVRVTDVGFSAELAGGGGPPEIKARRYFPVICIRNKRGERSCVPDSLLLLHIYLVIRPSDGLLRNLPGYFLDKE